MTKAGVMDVLNKIGAVMAENKEYLTDLDSPIGDSDHGINMARGFTAVVEKLPTLAEKDLGAMFKTVGMTIVSAVGGSSGPLYGTAFMRAGAVLAGKDEMTAADLLGCIDAGIEGIVTRGKATTGEKTMLDAIIPARDAYKAELEAGGDAKAALTKAVAAAEAGCEYTKTIIATKGRASYLGERGIGHQDPGATSATLMLKVMLEAVS